MTECCKERMYGCSHTYVKKKKCTQPRIVKPCGCKKKISCCSKEGRGTVAYVSEPCVIAKKQSCGCGCKVNACEENKCGTGEVTYL